MLLRYSSLVDLKSIECLVASKQRKFLQRFSVSSHFPSLDEKTKYFIHSRVNYLRKLKPRPKERECISWQVQFSHKIMGDINLNSIINYANVKKNLPANLKNKFRTRLIYKFGKTIGSKILNYNDVLRNTGNLQFDDILNMQCNCDDSLHKNDQFGHIITGDLEIIENPELRKLCAFGTKFRENPLLDFGKIKAQIKKDIDSLAGKIASKFRVSRSIFKKWKDSLFHNFCQKLFSCFGNKSYQKPVLMNRDCKNELDRLRDKFVITVVDKASGNFAFCCKKLYFLKLAKELGLDNPQPGNDTYTFIQDSEDNIVNKIMDDLQGFRINPDENQSKLALLYQTP